VGNVACIEARGSAYRVLVGKPEGKGPLGRHRQKLAHNIKIVSLRNGMGTWTGFIWLGQGQVADPVNTVMQIRLYKRGIP